jgi:signal transduction histidine kinase
MSLRVRTCFGILIWWLSFFNASAIQDDDSGIAWYESFFQERKQKPVEDVLASATSKLDQATDVRDGVAEAAALKELALIHLTRTNNYEQALDFLIRCLAIEDSLQLKENQVFTYLAMAKVFEEVGDYYKSAEFLKQALDINEQARHVSVLVLILNELGKINAAMGRIDEAFENYEQVLRYKDQIEMPKAEAEALFNLAQLYALQGEYTDALSNHKRALAIRRSIRDKENEALSLNTIGELYRLMKNDEKALANHVVALELRQALNDKKGMAESFNNIGALYLQQKNFQRAIANISLGLEAGQESQAQNQIRRSFEYLSQCYEQLGDYKQALKNKDRFLAMNDLIENEKNDQRLLEIQNRYVIDKKESQIEKLESDRVQREKELQTQKKFRNFLFVLTGLSIIILLLILYLYLLKQRSNKILQAAHAKVNQQNSELQDLNATKDKFFSIISHDLKGPLNSLTSFSGLLINHTDSLSKEEIQMLAKDLDKTLKNLFALLENLLEWSRSQTGNIEFTPEHFDMATVLEGNKELLQAQAQSKKISLIRGDTGEVPVSAHKNSINTVVRNLISNAIKFTPEGGTITLGLRLSQNNEVVVSVADTGVGMSGDILKKLFRIDTKHSTKGTANEKGTGLGLILCKEFVEKNGGRLWVESEVGKGSVFYFTVPNAVVTR